MKNTDKQDLQKQINDSGLILESLEKKVNELKAESFCNTARKCVMTFNKEIRDSEESELSSVGCRCRCTYDIPESRTHRRNDLMVALEIQIDHAEENEYRITPSMIRKIIKRFR